MAKLSALAANDQSRSDNSLPVRVPSPGPRSASPSRPPIASPSRLRQASGPTLSADVPMPDAQQDGLTASEEAAQVCCPAYSVVLM